MATVFGLVGWVSLSTSDRDGTMYLRLASDSHQSSCLSSPSAQNTHLRHVMTFKVTNRDYADSSQCILYTLKIPFCLHSEFQTQRFSWFALVFNSHVLESPILCYLKHYTIINNIPNYTWYKLGIVGGTFIVPDIVPGWDKKLFELKNSWAGWGN